MSPSTRIGKSRGLGTTNWMPIFPESGNPSHTMENYGTSHGYMHLANWYVANRVGNNVDRTRPDSTRSKVQSRPTFPVDVKALFSSVKTGKDSHFPKEYLDTPHKHQRKTRYRFRGFRGKIGYIRLAPWRVICRLCRMVVRRINVEENGLKARQHKACGLQPQVKYGLGKHAVGVPEHKTRLLLRPYRPRILLWT
jgi:hypothetical protein